MKTVFKDKYHLTIIPRHQHTISRKNISENALKVLYRLNKAGYEAYLVGGSVRDLLLGKNPKDFDITTNALPNQIRTLFRNCRLIGRRFRLAHIIFGSEIIEVATFRGQYQIRTLDKSTTGIAMTNHNGMLLHDNSFGSIEEDAQRRDFSVNSLYYNVADSTLRDYTGGFKDLQEGTIRLNGNPETRYREDPVRMLRAIRFAIQLNMNISRNTAEPILRLAALLYDISPARLFEEVLKLLHAGYGQDTYRLLCKYKLFQPLFPLISCHFTQYGDSYMEQMIIRVLANTDYQYLRSKIRINPAFLFAAMLWYPLLGHTQKLTQQNNNLSYFDAFSLAIGNILYKQCLTLALPKRLTIQIRNIWQLQIRLSRQYTKSTNKPIEYLKFRGAYDLLKLRAEIEHNTKLQQIIHWDSCFQIATPLWHKSLLTTTSLNDNYLPGHHQHHLRLLVSNRNNGT